ncbi:MAG: T9SS type A sorting domain-containing protein, partial [Bacteroidota bacterium]
NLTNCIISNRSTQDNLSTEGLHVSSDPIPGDGVITVSNCTLTNNGNGTIAGQSGMDLSGNYFGSTDESTIASLVGTGNDFSPWLGSGTDTDIGTEGFQGDFSDLHIGTSGSQTTNFFQEAHDLLTSGGAITVNSGTYSESLTTTQDMTLSPAAGTSIDNLTLNGGNVTLLADLTISNTLTLTNGILDLDLDDGDRSDDPVLTLSNAVSGTGSNTNHIEGKVAVAIGAAGSYTFPMGDFGTHRPVVVSPTNATTFSVAHVWRESPSGAGANGSMLDLIGDISSEFNPDDIESVLSGMYWEIDIVSGTPGTTTVTIQINGSDNATDASTLGIARFDGTNWSEITRTGGSGSDPYTVSGTTSSFSDFSVYSSNSTDNPLPVELIDFKGEIDETGRVRLEWATASEINSDYFQVEKKVGEEEEFEAIGSLKSSGNSTSRIDYEFTEVSNTTAPLYYRLKMVDFDGTYDYSKTIILIPSFTSKELTLYPNPSRESITLQGVDPIYIREVRFYDMMGRHKKSLNQFDSNQWSVEDLVSGHYILHVEMLDGKLFRGEIVVED